MKFDFIEVLRVRTASAAIGASTARRMGPPGTISAARIFLKSLDISRFSTESIELFQQELDKATLGFIDTMPVGAQNWGSCRKFINIFLRDVVYNNYLMAHFDLSKVIGWLEVPLDSHVAKGLRDDPDGESLPRWKSVIGLNQETSNKYQTIAKIVAARLNTQPVHLDVLYWRSA